MTEYILQQKPVVVALDFAQESALYNLVDQLDPTQCRLKVGKELFTRFGPQVVKSLQERGFDVFLDLKFHDIPNTVAKAVAAAADLGVWMVNVHALGGAAMMEQAKKQLESFGNDAPLLIAVTILTSTNDETLSQLHLPPVKQMVPELALMAKNSGLDGVVCSAQEAAMIKQHCGNGFATVTPGIRPEGSAQDDQYRILTPEQAVQQGADYLVIGRPITQHESPLEQLQQINQSLNV